MKPFDSRAYDRGRVEVETKDQLVRVNNQWLSRQERTSLATSGERTIQPAELLLSHHCTLGTIINLKFSSFSSHCTPIVQLLSIQLQRRQDLGEERPGEIEQASCTATAHVNLRHIIHCPAGDHHSTTVFPHDLKRFW